jgi:hypothetical protein
MIIRRTESLCGTCYDRVSACQPPAPAGADGAGVTWPCNACSRPVECMLTPRLLFVLRLLNERTAPPWRAARYVSGPHCPLRACGESHRLTWRRSAGSACAIRPTRPRYIDFCTARRKRPRIIHLPGESLGRVVQISAIITGTREAYGGTNALFRSVLEEEQAKFNER